MYTCTTIQLNSDYLAERAIRSPSFLQFRSSGNFHSIATYSACIGYHALHAFSSFLPLPGFLYLELFVELLISIKTYGMMFEASYCAVRLYISVPIAVLRIHVV